MAERRYFWLKISQSFFNQIEIKRAIAKKEDRILVLYMGLMLRSLDYDGCIYLDGQECDSEEFLLSLELSAFKCTEKEAGKLLSWLEQNKLVERRSPNEIFLPMVKTITGTETDAAVRMRRSREKKKKELEAQLDKQLEEITNE